MNKKILGLLFLILLILPACALIPDIPAKVTGSGNVISENRTATDFSQISLEGSAEVNVTFGNVESVNISGEDNIISLIETNVVNHKLIIKTKPLMTYSATKPVVINITMKTLEGLSLSGSGNINISKFEGDAFDVNLAGSGDINFSGYSGESIDVDLPGSGTIVLAGSASRIQISLGGSGNILANKLQAKSATVTLNGSGNIKVYCSESLNATLNGSGNIQYEGNPLTVNKKVNGSGNISE